MNVEHTPIKIISDPSNSNRQIVTVLENSLRLLIIDKSLETAFNPNATDFNEIIFEVDYYPNSEFIEGDVPNATHYYLLLEKKNWENVFNQYHLFDIAMSIQSSRKLGLSLDIHSGNQATENFADEFHLPLFNHIFKKNTPARQIIESRPMQVSFEVIDLSIETSYSLDKLSANQVAFIISLIDTETKPDGRFLFVALKPAHIDNSNFYKLNIERFVGSYFESIGKSFAYFNIHPANSVTETLCLSHN